MKLQLEKFIILGMKCFHWVDFSYNVSQSLICIFISIIFIFVGLD